MKKQKETHKKAYAFFKGVLGIVFKIYYRPKIVNKEYIPEEGPIIVCCNHIHLFDQCLPIMSTKRMLHYMAKKEYFDGKFAWFFKAAGCISVDRSIHDHEATRGALDVLNNGWALGIFPEGTRNRTNETLLPFKHGAVSMAKKTGATIVPCAITGKYKFWKNNLTLTFLKPFKINEDDDVHEKNDELREMIKEFIESKNNNVK